MVSDDSRDSVFLGSGSSSDVTSAVDRPPDPPRELLCRCNVLSFFCVAAGDEEPDFLRLCPSYSLAGEMSLVVGFEVFLLLEPPFPLESYMAVVIVVVVVVGLLQTGGEMPGSPTYSLSSINLFRADSTSTGFKLLLGRRYSLSLSEKDEEDDVHFDF